MKLPPVWVNPNTSRYIADCQLPIADLFVNPREYRKVFKAAIAN